MNDFFFLSTALNGKIPLRRKGLPRSSLAKARLKQAWVWHKGCKLLTNAQECAGLQLCAVWTKLVCFDTVSESLMTNSVQDRIMSLGAIDIAGRVPQRCSTTRLELR